MSPIYCAEHQHAFSGSWRGIWVRSAQQQCFLFVASISQNCHFGVQNARFFSILLHLLLMFDKFGARTWFCWLYKSLNPYRYIQILMLCCSKPTFRSVKSFSLAAQTHHISKLSGVQTGSSQIRTPTVTCCFPDLWLCLKTGYPIPVAYHGLS